MAGDVNKQNTQVTSLETTNPAEGIHLNKAHASVLSPLHASEKVACALKAFIHRRID